jgi:hypothetical protein
MSESVMAAACFNDTFPNFLGRNKETMRKDT